MRIALVIFVSGCGLLSNGCARLAQTPPMPPSGSIGVEAREIRCNAVLALLHRGSLRVKDEEVWDVLTAMLDEEQQLRSFQKRIPDGGSVTDETAGRMTVIGALRAVRELHKKQPEIDLTGLRQPLDRLTSSSNSAIRAEANETRRVLFPQT